MIAILQQHKCKLPFDSIAANALMMDGLEADTDLIRRLCQFAGLVPTRLAKEVGLTPTTILRPYRGTAETRLSRSTLEKLQSRWPEFPDWKTQYPDQVGMAGAVIDPNERPEELVYIRSFDISYGMGGGGNIEDFPATGLVPFNLPFIRAISRASTESLFIGTGHGDSMEPTLLRSDLLLFDSTMREPIISDQIYAFDYAGSGYVKRLRRIRSDGRDFYLIISNNPAVPPQQAEIADVTITGRVIWVGRRM